MSKQNLGKKKKNRQKINLWKKKIEKQKKRPEREAKIHIY